MKIVILDGYSVTQSDLDWQPLANVPGLEVTQYERTTPEQTTERCREAEAVLTNKVAFDRKTLAALPRLRYIGVLATGYNVVDTEAARERGPSAERNEPCQPLRRREPSRTMGRESRLLLGGHATDGTGRKDAARPWHGEHRMASRHNRHCIRNEGPGRHGP